jgi:hypothetical protein
LDFLSRLFDDAVRILLDFSKNTRSTETCVTVFLLKKNVQECVQGENQNDAPTNQKLKLIIVLLVSVSQKKATTA